MQRVEPDDESEDDQDGELAQPQQPHAPRAGKARNQGEYPVEHQRNGEVGRLNPELIDHRVHEEENAESRPGHAENADEPPSVAHA